MMEQTTSIIDSWSFKGDMSGTGYKFFDRISGILYPGNISSIRRESSKYEPTTITNIGYESAYMNPMKNFGEFVQSDGKMRLETFKVGNNVPDGTMDINFEFMSQDSNTYTFNELIIAWCFESPNGNAVHFTSAPLKLVGGIKDNTRIYLNRFGIKYHYATMRELFDRIHKAFSEGSIIPLAIEVYIK